MALIPFDVALSGLNTIAGIFGATEKDKQRQRMLDEAARRQALVAEKYRQYTNRANEEFNRLEQSGAFNADEELNLINRATAEELGTNLGNQFAWLRGLGYKPEDAPLTLGAKKLTADSALKAEAQALAAKNAARERRRQALADLYAVQNQEAQFLTGSGNEMMNRAMSMPGGNLESTISAAMSGGLPQKIAEALKKKKEEPIPGVTPLNPNAKPYYVPGSLAAGLDQFRNIQFSNIPLTGISQRFGK